MAVPLFLLPGSPLESLCEVARGEAIERLVDLVRSREGVQPRRALVQLAGRLRAAEHQDAEHRDLVVREPERLVEELAILGSAAAGPAREARPAAPGESLQGLVDLPLVVGDDRIAVRRLVAGQPESVQREGYWSGVVRCFSSRHPSTRSST